MENAKREMTLEELEKEYAKATEEYYNLEKQLKQKQQEEKDRRTAQLAVDKEKRKKEVEEAYNHYSKLVKAYIKDYGSISITDTLDDIGSIFDLKPFRGWL